MIDRVRASIARHRMLPEGSRVVVAISGGADSVGLLHVLREIGANVVGIAHFNHKLRGEESEEDERFVAAIASRLDLPFYRSAARPDAGNLEQQARRARREFFRQLIRDKACDRVALGHTRDDQAETVLFRILRGSGLAGIAGILPITEDGIVRPLIDVGRDEVRQYLSALGIEWREDSSNTARDFARNRIRHDLLPQLRREWNPRIDTALAQMADLAYEEELFWRSCWPPQPTSDQVHVHQLHSLQRGLARRMVRAKIAKVKGDLRSIEFRHIERILEMPPGRLRLPGLYVTRSYDWIHFSASLPAAIEPIEAIVPNTYAAFDVRLEFDETPAPGCDNLRVELTAPLVLRGWRSGDHYRPVGKSREYKLKELFQNARIPSWQRPAWPILECRGKILWAREFGAADEFAVNGRQGPVLRIWDLKKES